MRTISLTLIALLCCAQAHAQFIPGAIAAWSFNNGNAQDDIGSHDGVVSFATLAPDRFGNGNNAYAFSGNLTNIQVAADPLFTMADSSFSVSLWFKSLNDTSVAGQDMVSWYRCGANAGCGPADAAFFMVRLTGGRVGCQVRDDQAHAIVLTSAPDSTFDDGTWHHAVMTVDQSLDEVKLYVDASLQAAQTDTLNTLSAGSVQVPLNFGRRYRMGWATSGFYFKGGLDDIAIYRRALTQGEVVQLFTMADPNVGLAEGNATLPVSVRHDADNDRFVITAELPMNGSVRVLDLQGRQLTKRPVAQGVTYVPTIAWARGCYVVHVEAGQGRHAVTRVVVP